MELTIGEVAEGYVYQNNFVYNGASFPLPSSHGEVIRINHVPAADLYLPNTVQQ
jgi:hypothetical protein